MGHWQESCVVTRVMSNVRFGSALWTSQHLVDTR